MATKGFSSNEAGTSTSSKPKKTVNPKPATNTVTIPGIPKASSAITPTNQQGTPQAFTSSDMARSTGTPTTAASTGGAPTSAGVPGYNQGTTDPITGAIAGYGYTPQGLASIYDNPTILTSDLLKAMGIDNAGMAQSLGQYLDPAVAANFLTNKGMGSSSSDSSTLNFANEYLKQMVTPNGRTPEFDYLVNALLGAGSDSSPLGAYLNSGLTPDQQIQAANALFGQTLVGLNPYSQQAYSRYAKDQGNQYLGNVAKGQPGGSSYVDYLNSTPLKQWVNR